MRKHLSVYLILFGAVIFIGLFVTIVFHSYSNTKNKIDTVHTPTTTTTLVASFKEDEITRVGELKYNGTTYVGDIYVRYTDKSRGIFSDLIVSRDVEGKNIILYKLTKDGFFRFGERDIGFNEKEFGGFLGFIAPLIGNDFFVVQYLGADKTKFSDPLIVY